MEPRLDRDGPGPAPLRRAAAVLDNARALRRGPRVVRTRAGSRARGRATACPREGAQLRGPARLPPGRLRGVAGAARGEPRDPAAGRGPAERGGITQPP